MSSDAQHRLAVVGAGHWGPHLIRNFHEHPASEVAYIVERDRERWPALQARFAGMLVTDDWAAVLADDELDGVVIATPTSTHFPLASEALECGKHVLVEKPLTDSADTSQRLVDMADDLDRVLMVGHVFLFNPAIEAAKQLIDDGELGPIHYISMNRTNLGPVRVDVNAGWDLAAHDISIASHWLGATPLYASATGGSWINPGVHDALFITLTYPQDVLVHIEVSWLHPRKDRLISVVGGARMATVDDVDLSEPLRVYDKGVAVSDGDLADTFAGFRSQIREGTVTIPRIPGGEPLRRECEAFIARLAGDRSTLSDGREALAVVQTLEAIDESLKQGGAEVAIRAGS